MCNVLVYLTLNAGGWWVLTPQTPSVGGGYVLHVAGTRQSLQPLQKCLLPVHLLHGAGCVRMYPSYYK